MTDQTRKIEDLLTRGTDGIAISPIDPDQPGRNSQQGRRRRPI